MKRIPNWEHELRGVHAQYMAAPFEWGRSDCACWAADCIEAITERDVLGPLRGSYTSRLSSRARLRAKGWDGLGDALASILGPLGAVRIEPHFARVGDIAVTECGVLCVRFPSGFYGRPECGGLNMPQRIREAWAIGWG